MDSARNFWFKYIVIYLCAVLGACNGRNCETRIPAETFFKSSETSLFRISPDGKCISFVESNKNGRKNVFVRHIGARTKIRLTAFDDKSIRDYCWVGSKNLAMIVEDVSGKNFELYIVERGGKKLQRITFVHGITKMDFIQKGNKADNVKVLVAMNDKNPEKTTVYQLDVKTGEKQAVVENPGNIIEWVADQNNVVRLAKGSEGTKEIWYYRENNNVQFRKIISNHFSSGIVPLLFSKNKKHHFFALSNIGRDKFALVEIDGSTGSETAQIYQNKDADVTKAVYSTNTGKIIYVTTDLEKGKIHFVSRDEQGSYIRINKKFKSDAIEIVDCDDKERNIIIRVFNDKNPGTYYLVRAEKGEFIKLGNVNADIKTENLRNMEPVSYRSRDGVLIHGYLTMPKNKTQRTPPLIVIPHSGPYRKVSWGYDPEVQFFANRGYAVLQPNFRGSGGSGKSFYEAGIKQWDKVMLEDIQDGVKWLVQSRLIDSNRIAAYGHGFGGLTAINLAIKYPQTYKSVISYSGILNMFSYIKSTPNYYKPHRHIIEALLGNPEKDIDYLRSVSPIFNTEKLVTPLLVFQGGKDPRCNIIETDQFIKELKKYNKQVQYSFREEEGRKINKIENKIYFYNEIEYFLSKNMK